MRSIYTVHPEGERWLVSVSGVPDPHSVHANHHQAIVCARDAAERDLPSRLVILNRDGQVESDRELGVDQQQADLDAQYADEPLLPIGLRRVPEMEEP